MHVLASAVVVPCLVVLLALPGCSAAPDDDVGNGCEGGGVWLSPFGGRRKACRITDNRIVPTVAAAADGSSQSWFFGRRVDNEVKQADDSALIEDGSYNYIVDPVVAVAEDFSFENVDRKIIAPLVRSIKEILRALMTILDEQLRAPATLGRVRRDVGDDNRSTFDAFLVAIGASWDMQDCRNRIACHAGKLLKRHVSGAQVGIMIAENAAPGFAQRLINVIKAAIFDPQPDSCVKDYRCDINPNH